MQEKGEERGREKVKRRKEEEREGEGGRKEGVRKKEGGSKEGWRKKETFHLFTSQMAVTFRSGTN